MIADGRANLLVNPCISLAPAVMVILTAASGTVLGDALYDRLSSGGGSR
jgi:peptide/nickel transport system permease protein/glutathione transport system permease protein